ncbi:N-acetylglucosamine-6-phosphate deacetylase [Donghicola sp. C2-DW-16]|uniref:N-acetylglucosamine-6-phosphate deacetylase n=1 Tax=Donghicola mangrovi TaxID=2729614 RepID=A0ABX2P9K8_9RHOB|nr:N-acetylglucosamine-6-phosphate deacetylase [Donghicola mangrovi]NVO26143.1 N-acetylglucosamine-6-phosphate deacetylase [Donghicola mangrovi]
MILSGARIFDGVKLREGASLAFHNGRIAGLTEKTGTNLGGGILCPGYVDIQVNGGGGAMFNEAPTVETLRLMAEAHGRLGATCILPTLITAPIETFQAAVNAIAQARTEGVKGIVGLHLEGPHLTRAGAHSEALLRPMTDIDVDLYCHAARVVGCLKITLAPEVVSDSQISKLHQSGVIVALGHTNAGYDRCRVAAKAGATVVTHLFNAMTGLHHREPGCVGAALADPRLSAGLIADTEHVHAGLLGMVWRAKAGTDRLFLVSDAMAVAGTDQTDFILNGRKVSRAKGRLTLADGTLAGADLNLSAAVRNMAAAGVPLAEALAMATRIPADIIGRDDLGRIEMGGPADLIHLSDDLHLLGVWRGGVKIA